MGIRMGIRMGTGMRRLAPTEIFGHYDAIFSRQIYMANPAHQADNFFFTIFKPSR